MTKSHLLIFFLNRFNVWLFRSSGISFYSNVLIRIPRYFNIFFALQCKAASTTLEEFENFALFLRLARPSTLIRNENGALRKRSSNWRNLKTTAVCFRLDRKHFENGASRKR